MSKDISHKPTLWELARKPLACAAIPLAIVAIKGGWNFASSQLGEPVPAQYLCLTDTARGRNEPYVPGKYDGDNLAHVLDLSDTPESGKTICFPTNGTVRVALGEKQGLWSDAADEWYRVRFREVAKAVNDHPQRVFEQQSGKAVSPEAARKLGEFASNWPVDILGTQHTWVNGARASTIVR